MIVVAVVAAVIHVLVLLVIALAHVAVLVMFIMKDRFVHQVHNALLHYKIWLIKLKDKLLFQVLM